MFFDLSYIWLQNLLQPPPQTILTPYEQKIRACWMVLVAVCMLKRLKKRSPKLFAFCENWCNYHRNKSVAELLQC